MRQQDVSDRRTSQELPLRDLRSSVSAKDLHRSHLDGRDLARPRHLRHRRDDLLLREEEEGRCPAK